MALFDLSYIQSLQVNQILFSFLLPFFVLFAIFWGLLTAMRIFGSKVNTVLALVFALVIIPTPAFVWFATYLVQLGTTVALAAFILLFIFGVIRWAFGRSKDIYYQTGGYDKRIDKLSKDMYKLVGKLERVSDNEKPAIQRRIDELDREIKRLQMLKQQFG